MLLFYRWIHGNSYAWEKTQFSWTERDQDSKYQRKLKGTSCPFTVMVDHRGVIKSRHVGYNHGDEKKIEQEIIELIKQANPDTLRLNVKTEDK